MSATRLLTGCLLLTACLTTGCEGMSNTAGGALVGAGAGTVAGAALGGPRGAILGALGGTLVGGAVGNSVDQQERRQAQAQVAAAQAAAGPPLGVIDVINMTRQGMSEAVIMNQIQATGSTFVITYGDLQAMQAEHVSPNVVAMMQSRPPGRRYYYAYGPGYYPPPPVVVPTVGVVVR